MFMVESPGSNQNREIPNLQKGKQASAALNNILIIVVPEHRLGALQIR
jgi:hypothetical protein